MRTLIAALCLIPLTLTLVGCGGGDGGADAGCTNPKLKLVSQSFKLEGTIEIQKPIPNSTTAYKMPLPLSVDERIDMEYMRMYAHITYEMAMPDPLAPSDPVQEMAADVRMMFNSKTKQAAYAMTGAMPGMPEQLNNCSFVTVAWLPDQAELAKCVKDGFEKDGFSPPDVAGMGLIGPECVKDGDNDVWSVSIENATEMGRIKMHESWTMDKDMLMRGVSIEVDAMGKATVKGELKTKEPPTAVGPSDDDIDFTKWGYECKEVPLGGPPMMPMQLQAMLKLNQNRPGAMSVLPLMMKAHEAEGRRLQGGMPPGMPGAPAWAMCFMPPMPPPPGVVAV